MSKIFVILLLMLFPQQYDSTLGRSVLYEIAPQNLLHNGEPAGQVIMSTGFSWTVANLPNSRLEWYNAGAFLGYATAIDVQGGSVYSTISPTGRVTLSINASPQVQLNGVALANSNIFNFTGTGVNVTTAWDAGGNNIATVTIPGANLQNVLNSAANAGNILTNPGPANNPFSFRRLRVTGAGTLTETAQELVLNVPSVGGGATLQNMIPSPPVGSGNILQNPGSASPFNFRALRVVAPLTMTVNASEIVIDGGYTHPTYTSFTFTPSITGTLLSVPAITTNSIGSVTNIQTINLTLPSGGGSGVAVNSLGTFTQINTGTGLTASAAGAAVTISSQGVGISNTTGAGVALVTPGSGFQMFHSVRKLKAGAGMIISIDADESVLFTSTGGGGGGAYTLNHTTFSGTPPSGGIGNVLTNPGAGPNFLFQPLLAGSNFTITQTLQGLVLAATTSGGGGSLNLISGNPAALDIAFPNASTAVLTPIFGGGGTANTISRSDHTHTYTQGGGNVTGTIGPGGTFSLTAPTSGGGGTFSNFVSGLPSVLNVTMTPGTVTTTPVGQSVTLTPSLSGNTLTLHQTVYQGGILSNSTPMSFTLPSSGGGGITGVTLTNFSPGFTVLQNNVVNGTTAFFKTLIAGSNVSISDNGFNLTINASAGAASGVLSLNSLTGNMLLSGANGISITPSGNIITIGYAGGGGGANVTLTNLGGTGIIANPGTGNSFNLKGLTATGGISIVDNGLTLQIVGSGGGGTSGVNVQGTGPYTNIQFAGAGFGGITNFGSTVQVTLLDSNSAGGVTVNGVGPFTSLNFTGNVSVSNNNINVLGGAGAVAQVTSGLPSVLQVTPTTGNVVVTPVGQTIILTPSISGNTLTVPQLSMQGGVLFNSTPIALTLPSGGGYTHPAYTPFTVTPLLSGNTLSVPQFTTDSIGSVTNAGLVSFTLPSGLPPTNSWSVLSVSGSSWVASDAFQLLDGNTAFSIRSRYANQNYRFDFSSSELWLSAGYPDLTGTLRLTAGGLIHTESRGDFNIKAERFLSLSGIINIAPLGSDRLGFFSKTPVTLQSVQPAATDPASTQALANQIRQILINYGLAA